MNKILFLLLSFGSLFSQNTNIFDENFDPSNLVEPNLKLHLIVKPNDENPEFLNNPIVDSIIDGFRIQVASTNDLDFANSLSNNIKDKFNYETYIIFDSPNYKLRVGDFISRKNAETIRVNLIKNGFDKSWIIRTKVYKK